MGAPTLNLQYLRNTAKTSIIVTDLTGLYDAVTNEGGYGGPNAAVGDFTAFNITVTLPDPSTLLPGSTSVTVDAYSALPSSANGTFELTSLAILGTADTVFIDGVYLFTVSAPYDDNDPPTVAEATDYQPFYEIAVCCADNIITDAVGCGCSSTSKKIQGIIKAIINIYALTHTIYNEIIVIPSPLEQCEQWNKAATAILALQDFCENENCGGCNGCN